MITRYTSDEIYAILKKLQEAKDQGMTIKEFAQQQHIPLAKVYDWKKKYGPGKLYEQGPNGTSERKVRVKNDTEKLLRIENQRLKMIVAEQALDIQTLKEYAGKV